MSQILAPAVRLCLPWLSVVLYPSGTVGQSELTPSLSYFTLGHGI